MSHHIWIIGAGKFGMRAAQKLGQQKGREQITIVDGDAASCRSAAACGFQTVCMDGVAFLAANLVSSQDPEWIIPSIPVHVAFEWIQAKLTPPYHLEKLAVPQDLVETLPNTFSGPGGELYISNADFICPENCPEPADICMHTGKARPRILHQTLADIQYQNYRSIVVRSYQLGPGVGGYRPSQLFKARAAVMSDITQPILLSTACKCHGVMHAFRIIKG